MDRKSEINGCAKGCGLVLTVSGETFTSAEARPQTQRSPSQIYDCKYAQTTRGMVSHWDLSDRGQKSKALALLTIRVTPDQQSMCISSFRCCSEVTRAGPNASILCTYKSTLDSWNTHGVVDSMKYLSQPAVQFFTVVPPRESSSEQYQQQPPT